MREVKSVINSESINTNSCKYVLSSVHICNAKTFSTGQVRCTEAAVKEKVNDAILSCNVKNV